MEGLLFLMDIDENRNYIFIQLYYELEVYTVFVDKRNNSVTFCRSGNSGISGLKDDESGLMEVVPKGFHSEK